MTIAEKLITIADQTPQVAAAVRAAQTSRTDKAIRLDTGVGLQVTATPNSEVTVYGKNIFNIKDSQFSGEPYATGVEGNRKLVVTVQQTGNNRSANYRIPLGESLVGKKMSLRGRWQVSGSNKGAIRLAWMAKENIHAMVSMAGALNQSGSVVSFTVPSKPASAGELCLCFCGNVDGAAQVGDTATYELVQLELANASGSYAEYRRAQTYTADSQGHLPDFAAPMPVTLVAEQPVTCRYFPTSAAQIYETYQQLKEAFHV